MLVNELPSIQISEHVEASTEIEIDTEIKLPLYFPLPSESYVDVKSPKIFIELQGIQLPIMVDTGAEVSVVPTLVITQLMPNRQNELKTKYVQTLGERTEVLKGPLDLDVNISGIRLRCPFYCHDRITTPVMGIGLIAAAGLMIDPRNRCLRSIFDIGQENTKTIQFAEEQQVNALTISERLMASRESAASVEPSSRNSLSTTADLPNTATPYKTCRISVVPDDMLGNNVISVQPRSVDGSTSQHFTVVTSNSHPSFPSAAYSVKFDGVETPSSTACVLNEETLETDMHNSPSFAEELDTTSSSTDAHEHHFCPRAESSSNTLTSSGSHASVHFDTTLFSQNGQVMSSFIESSPSMSGSLTIKSVNDAIATTSTPVSYTHLTLPTIYSV